MWDEHRREISSLSTLPIISPNQRQLANSSLVLKVVLIRVVILRISTSAVHWVSNRKTLCNTNSLNLLQSSTAPTRMIEMAYRLLLSSLQM